MLIDSGADATLIPRTAIARLGITLDAALVYELIGFDGTHSTAQAIDLEMIFLQKIFSGRYLMIDSDHGILGRDVLNRLALTLDGPAGEWANVTTGQGEGNK